MNAKNFIGSLLILILQSNLLTAQHSIELEAIYSISSEKFAPTNDALDIFDSKIFHSFGLNGRKVFKSKIFAIAGIHLRRFGTQFDVEETTESMPEGTGEFFEVNWNANSIDIPVRLGYYFLDRNTLRIGFAIGISNSFVLNQKQIAKGMETDIEVYESYIFNLNSSVELGIKVKKSVIVSIIPIWQRQMNANLSVYKQRGFGCHLGISYQLKE